MVTLDYDSFLAHYSLLAAPHNPLQKFKMKIFKEHFKMEQLLYVS